jgi:hypothetical protein
MIKRLFDIAASLLGLLLSCLVFLFVAILTKRDSPGPIFYRGRRHIGGETLCDQDSCNDKIHPPTPAGRRQHSGFGAERCGSQAR